MATALPAKENKDWFESSYRLQSAKSSFGCSFHIEKFMTLIVKPIFTKIEERTEPKTHFRVFNNMGNFRWFDGHGLADVQEWIDEQAFTVVMYRGWWHDFFFEHSDHFLLTKLVYPNYQWHVDSSQPEQFKEFAREWRIQYLAKEAAYIEKIRREREDQKD